MPPRTPAQPARADEATSTPRTITAHIVVRETDNPGGWGYYTLTLPESWLADATPIRRHEPQWTCRAFLEQTLDKAAQS